MALGEGEAKSKSRFDLQDVLFDSTLREAFHCHLSGCLMAEVLDLWLALNRFFEISGILFFFLDSLFYFFHPQHFFIFFFKRRERENSIFCCNMSRVFSPKLHQSCEPLF